MSGNLDKFYEPAAKIWPQVKQGDTMLVSLSGSVSARQILEKMGLPEGAEMTPVVIEQADMYYDAEKDVLYIDGGPE